MVRQRVVDALTRFVHPLTGGADGTGWPFDTDLTAAAVTQVIEAVEGVLSVDEVQLFEYDLRTGRRIGGGRESIVLEPHSLFLSAEHRWSCDEPATRRLAAAPAPAGDAVGGLLRALRVASSRSRPARSSRTPTTSPTWRTCALTPPAMVRWMAQWLGLPGIDPEYSEAVQRRILATAAATLQLRGTTAGLTRLLELYSGGPVIVSEGGGIFEQGEAPVGPAWVVMEVPSTGLLEEADFLSPGARRGARARARRDLGGAAPHLADARTTGREGGVMTDARPSGTIVDPAAPSAAPPSPVHADQRLADDFCPTCDYPLFWARPSVAPAGVEGSHRRRPAPRARRLGDRDPRHAGVPGVQRAQRAERRSCASGAART